jgi:hypothetical protein
MHGSAKEQELRETSIPGTSPTASAECGLRQTEAISFLKRVPAKPGTDSAIEKRSEPRVPTDDPGSMRVLHPFMAERFAVRVLDVSKNGLKLSSPVRLRPGMLVLVRIRNIIAMGEVRHGAAVGDEFHAGVHLDDVLMHNMPRGACAEALSTQPS